MKKLHRSYAAVLFDLDGTLIDSAEDLGAALNSVLVQHGLATVARVQFQPWVSNGSLAMLQGGFGKVWQTLSSEAITQLKHDFLDHYKDNLFNKSELYNGIESLITAIEAAHIPWGIMTNKPQALTDPLVNQIKLFKNAAIVVSGDTLTVAKPNPEPLLHCAQKIGVTPQQCIYIGDDERDIIAGKAAGMDTMVARWGYLNRAQSHQWQADFNAESAQEALNYILG